MKPCIEWCCIICLRCSSLQSFWPSIYLLDLLTSLICAMFKAIGPSMKLRALPIDLHGLTQQKWPPSSVSMSDDVWTMILEASFMNYLVLKINECFDIQYCSSLYQSGFLTAMTDDDLDVVGRLNINNHRILHPWRLTWNMSSWRFGSDHFPFQMGDL